MKEYKELTIDYGKGAIKKLPAHKHFSGSYVDERNRFVPQAEKHANGKFGTILKGGSQADREEWTAQWNRAYHGKMDSLWAGRAR